MADDEELTDEEREILKFESQGWRQAGAKETAIRDRFGMSWVRYYQKLSRIIQKPAAMDYDPGLVGRLERQRASGVARKYVRGD